MDIIAQRLPMLNGTSSSLEGFQSAFALERRDPRVDSWPLMGSIWPSFVLCSLYVVLVKVIGPSFMKDRKPYDLKGLMQCYNVFQVIGSFSVFLAFMKNGWFGEYSLVCEPIDSNPDPTAHPYNMAAVCWVGFLFRFVDFADTIFFVARKKFNQVLHHFLTPMYAWLITRYYPGGNATWGAMLNFFVHTIMYSYYFLASLGPRYAKFLWWKRYLTSFQLSVFVVSFARSFFNVIGAVECGFPWQMDFVSVLMFSLMFVLFAEFYIKAYVKKSPKKA